MKAVLSVLATIIVFWGVVLSFIFLTCVIAIAWIHTEAVRDGAGRWTSEPDNPSGFHIYRNFEWVTPKTHSALAHNHDNG